VQPLLRFRPSEFPTLFTAIKVSSGRRRRSLILLSSFVLDVSWPKQM